MEIGDEILVYSRAHEYLHGEVEAVSDRAIYVCGVWLPKSQLIPTDVEGVFHVPDWLVDKCVDFFEGRFTEDVRKARIDEIVREMKAASKTQLQRTLAARYRPPLDDDYLGV
ncbi:MAG: hypothetical protein ACXQS4_02465 [Methermicoccaceae archaeon]